CPARRRWLRGCWRGFPDLVLTVALALAQACGKPQCRARGSKPKVAHPAKSKGKPMSAAVVAALAEAPQRKPLYRSLYFQVIVAVVCGVLLGHFSPAFAADLNPLGDGFIKLIKMM